MKEPDLDWTPHEEGGNLRGDFGRRTLCAPNNNKISSFSLYISLYTYIYISLQTWIICVPSASLRFLYYLWRIPICDSLRSWLQRTESQALCSVLRIHRKLKSQTRIQNVQEHKSGSDQFQGSSESSLCSAGMAASAWVCSIVTHQAVRREESCAARGTAVRP